MSESNIVEFPTRPEGAAEEDMHHLCENLMYAGMAIKHSVNVAEEDRAEDLEVLTGLFIKYFNLAIERYPNFTTEPEDR